MPNVNGLKTASRTTRCEVNMLAVKNAYLALLTARAKSVDLDKRVCYLLSFADNDGGAIEGLYQQYGANFLLAYTPQMAEVAASYGVKGVTITPFTLRKLVLGSAWQKIARCQVIIADNYYPELLRSSAPTKNHPDLACHRGFESIRLARPKDKAA